MADRVPFDAYMTPDELAEACCRKLAPLLETDAPVVGEPTCGEGSFIRGALKVWPGALVFAHDVQPQFRPHVIDAGGLWALDVALEFPQLDIVIGNPPFDETDEIIAENVLALQRCGLLAFVLRHSYLCGPRVRGLYKFIGPPSDIWPIYPRPAFSEVWPDGSRVEATGGDNADVDLVAWRGWQPRARASDSKTIYHLDDPVLWRKPSRRPAARPEAPR